MVSPRWLLAAWIGALGLMPLTRVAAQAVPASQRCDGDTVTAIDVRTRPPSEHFWDATAHALGIHLPTTRPTVVRAYLRLTVGRVCTEKDRSESERLLRAQPFIATAAVRTIPDGPRRVRVQVDVLDELPFIATAALRHGSPALLLLGTQNLQGRGLAIAVRGTRGFAFRNGFGIRVTQYGIFGRPDYVAISAERTPLGQKLSFEFAEPFLTSLQGPAFLAGAAEARDYFGVVRPTGDVVSLFTRRISYHVGWVTRVGRPDLQHTVGLVGAAVLGDAAHAGTEPTIVTDSGLVDAPDAAGTFLGRYPPAATAHVAIIGGLRSVRFVTVQGFDALTAAQDVGAGIQVDLLAGPSVWESQGGTDLLLAGDLYAGVGTSTSFFAARLLGEGTDNHTTGSWDGLVGSARLSWYGKFLPTETHIASLDLSAVQNLSFPAQLTFRDPDGGVPGYQSATGAGGRRAVARLEERHNIGLFKLPGDFGVAAFAVGGKLWAGDVPYGITTPIRSAVGLSLLGAYPSGSQRTYRLDVAYALEPELGGSRVSVRIVAADRTGLLWLEPRDVSRARTGAVPTNLMKW